MWISIMTMNTIHYKTRTKYYNGVSQKRRSQLKMFLFKKRNNELFTFQPV